MDSGTKTLCTLCGVVDQVSVTDAGKVLSTGSIGVCQKGVSFFRDRVRGKEDAERFTSPMIRTPSGWEHISWDHAINKVAETILADRAKYGRDAIAFYGVGQMTTEALWVTKKLFQGHLGTNNVCSNAEQCLSNNAGGHELVFGNEGPFTCYDDYLAAEAIFIYGHNPAVNHPTVFNRYIRKNDGAVKVVVDPRVSNTVEALLKDDPGNIHLQINSGADLLLNCVIARRLLETGGFADTYVAKYVDQESVAAYFTFLRNGPFSYQAAIPKLRPSHISHEEMAQRLDRVVDLWRTRKVVSTSSVGINQTTGSSGIASILNLHLLTGNIGAEGRGHVRLAGQSNASAELALGYSARLLPFRMRVADPEHRRKMAEIWGLPEWKINDRTGLPVASFVTSERLRTLFVCGTNPARNFPNLNKWREKMRDLFIVYVDTYFNPEILDYADIILPCRSKHEIDGIFLNGERRLQYLKKFAEPPTEAWSDARIVCSLARRIASRLEPFADPGPTSAEEVDALVARNNADLIKERLESDFSYPVDSSDEPLSQPIWNEIQRASQGFYNAFADGDGKAITVEHIQADEGVQWGGARRYQPSPDDDGAIFPGIMAADRHRARFHLPQEDLLVPFIHRVPDQFTLITGRGGLGRGTSKVNIALFNSATATGRQHWPMENLVYVSATDAETLSIQTGDTVELANELGKLAGKACVTDGLPAQHLYMSFHPDRKGTAPNVLTHSDRYDAHTWQPLLKDTQVMLRKLDR